MFNGGGFLCKSNRRAVTLNAGADSCLQLLSDAGACSSASITSQPLVFNSAQSDVSHSRFNICLCTSFLL